MERLYRPLLEFGHAGHLWEGELLSDHLRRHYGATFGVLLGWDLESSDFLRGALQGGIRNDVTSVPSASV